MVVDVVVLLVVEVVVIARSALMASFSAVDARLCLIIFSELGEKKDMVVLF